MDRQPYMVTQDGRPIKRGLSLTEAHAYANQLAQGYEGHRASDRRRVAEFNVVPDKQLVAEHDDNYNWLKEHICCGRT